MLKILLQPHSIIVTFLIFLFIWVLNFLQLNMHFLDPFNNSIKEYEITDIVYAYLAQRPDQDKQEKEIVIINCGQPDRRKTIALLNKLETAGAKVIGLDLLFEENHRTATDTLLQETFKKYNNIVIACELHHQADNLGTFDRWVGVDPFFSDYARLGYVNFPANETKTIRIFSPREKVGQEWLPAFSTEITRIYQPEAVERLLQRQNEFEYIYYRGNKDLFIRHEIDYILDTFSVDEVRQVVQDKIVLVGYAAEDIWANPLTDRHYTPLNKKYSGKSIPDMYGVVIHANVISMLLKNNYITRIPEWLIGLIAVLFVYINVLLIHWIYDTFHEAFHGITRGLQVVEFILLFLVIALLFYISRLRLDFSLGILGLLFAYDIIMIYESLIRNRIPVLDRLPDHISFNLLRNKKKKKTDSSIEKTGPTTRNHFSEEEE